MDNYKWNVMIFPAGTEVSFEIQYSLKYFRSIELFAASNVSCHAEYVFKNHIEGLPFYWEENFVEEINKVIDLYHIDFIYPADDGAQLKMTREQDKLHARVVTSDLDTVETCRSKRKTYERLAGAWYLPKTYGSISEIDSYPVFIKPAVGQGSQGARRINSEEEFIKVPDDDYVICEYLSGEEYTVDCFTDRHFELKIAKQRVRERVKNGIAVRSSVMPEDPVVQEIAKDINAHFKFNGAWFFQLKKNNNGEYRLLEASPRIPGSMGTTRNLGINYPLNTLFNMADYDVDVIDNGNALTLDRSYIRRFKTDIKYSTVYVDFDDTIVLRGEVNTQLIQFLYQAVNQNKRIILLTKHGDGLEEKMKQCRIAFNLFDEIINIGRTDNKADFIKCKDAILIDDAYSERKSIHDKCGIPVFDLDMVESLLDYRQ